MWNFSRSKVYWKKYVYEKHALKRMKRKYFLKGWEYAWSRGYESLEIFVRNIPTLTMSSVDISLANGLRTLKIIGWKKTIEFFWSYFETIPSTWTILCCMWSIVERILLKFDHPEVLTFSSLQCRDFDLHFSL